MMLVMIDVIVMIIMMILLMMIMNKMMTVTSSSSGIGCVGVTACRVSPPPAESAMQYVIWIKSS